MYAEAVAEERSTAAGGGHGNHHVRLLTFGVSSDDSTRHISALRNAGVPASAHDMDQVTSPTEAGDDPIAELILVAADKTCQPSTVATLRKIGGGANVIALTKDRSGTTAAEWLQAGATDAVCGKDTDHFVAVVKREIANLQVERTCAKLQAENADFEKRCQALLESSREAICYVHDGMFVYANPSFLELFGLEQPEDVEGLTVLDLVAAPDHAKIKKALRANERATLEEIATAADGRAQRLQFEFSPARVEGEPCLQIIARKTQAVDAETLKGQDLLTGLKNRSGILEYLADTLQNEIIIEGQLSTLYIDTDRFREAVDQIGLGATDVVVTDLANLLRSCLGERDVVGRIGDSSFVVILMDRGKKAVSDLAHRIREAFADHISEAGEQSVNLTCSVGICEWVPGMNADSLVAAAASAAETASKAGGNQTHVYSADSGPGADADKRWVDAVKNALNKDGVFHLVFQPVVHLQGQVQDHYEVLLRMIGDNGQIVLPGYFLPPAERHGLMPEIDRWVIAEAVKTLGRRNEQSRATTLFVKLTSETLADETLMPWLAERLEDAGIDGRNLIFEMPEAKVRTQLKRVVEFVKAGRKLSCRFTIEQFAGDDNAFQLLDHVDAHFLKLDRALMSELPQRDDNRKRLTEMAARASSMGKQTIAEFVEDAASMSILWQSGVNFVQGHFLQEPEKVLAYEF